MPFGTALRAPAVSAWDRSPSEEKPNRPAFGVGGKPPKRSGGTALLVAILLSMWLHGTIFTSVVAWNWWHRHTAPVAEEGPQVEMVDLSKNPALKLKLDEIRKIAKLEEAHGLIPAPPPPDVKPGAQLVELAKSAHPEDAPKNARFLSEENHHVAEETVSRDQVMAPKVLADSFKGMGDKTGQGDSKFEGEKDKTGESAGHADKTELAKVGKKDANDSLSEEKVKPAHAEVADPFGIRVRPHEEETAPPPSGPRGTGADHDVDTTRAGGGTEVAMAGAPSNDYLPNVRQGDKTNLNAKQFVFASFWSRVQRQVEPFWVKHLHDSPAPGDLQKRDYPTRVNVTLAKDGSVVAVEIDRSCGVPGWDRAVVAAFNEGGPFPNPPPGMIDADGYIHMDDLGFIVSLTGGQIVHMYGDPRGNNLFPGIHEGMGLN